MAFANACTRQEINYQTSVLFTAQDIDYIVGLMCYLQLSLMGCAGYVVIGDTLRHPLTALDRRGLIPRPDQNIWYTPFYFRDIWHYRRIGAQMELLFPPVDTQDQQVTRKLGKQDAPTVSASPAPATGSSQQVTKPAAPPALPLRETKAGQLTLF